MKIRIVARADPCKFRETLPVALTSVKNADTESTRLAALRSYAILDTPAEPEFDELVRRAALELKLPIALLSVMDEQRCWFKAQTGLKPAVNCDELPREFTFCNYAFASSGTFVVPDARADQRFAKLPVVDRPGGYRFYAGAPLQTSDGQSLGTLCVLDYQPRELSAEQLGRLRRLADQAMNLLELRRARSATPAAVPPLLAQAVPAGGAGCILVVDDDELLRTFVRKLVVRLGYTALEAAHGAAALDQLEKHAGGIGLVLTDLNMPVMNGLALVRALKGMAAPPAIAVMSGRFDPAIRAALRAEGVTALLGKPFSVSELETTLLQVRTPVP